MQLRYSDQSLNFKVSDADFPQYLEVMEYKTVKTECKQQNDKSTVISQFNAESPFQIKPFTKYFSMEFLFHQKYYLLTFGKSIRLPVTKISLKIPFKNFELEQCHKSI